MKVMVKEIIGENCITLADGEKIFQMIHDDLINHRNVELNFAGVSVFASPFFNSSIGQLLKDNSPEDLNKNLKILDISPNGDITMRRVIENSKNFYSNREYRKSMDKLLVELSESSCR